MPFSTTDIEKLINEYEALPRTLSELNRRFIKANSNIGDSNAQEYLKHGCMRRLRMIQFSIHNIFTVLPPNRVELLDSNEQMTIESNLHTYAINLAGFFDNLAWVFAFHKNLVTTKKKGKDKSKLTQYDVGLFKKPTLDLLPVTIKNFLTSNEIKNWKDSYLKPYRDSLAHRIPLYLPKKVLSEEQESRIAAITSELEELNFENLDNRQRYNDLNQEKNSIGSISLSIRGSFSEEKFKSGILFHPQLLTDIGILCEISDLFINELSNAD